VPIVKRGDYYYSDKQSEIPEEIGRYSRQNGYPAGHFADAVCQCGMRSFRLFLDDNEGCAVRVCSECEHDHYIGDSEDYVDEAELHQPSCVCEGAVFEVTVGVALYQDSNDVRWLYLGCRCIVCGLTGVYGDWKNEFTGFEELLARV
jgi:hypothetical protein